MFTYKKTLKIKLSLRSRYLINKGIIYQNNRKKTTMNAFFIIKEIIKNVKISYNIVFIFYKFYFSKKIK